MKDWKAYIAIMVVSALATLLVATLAPPASAAQPAPPTVTACQVVNTFETISIARCVPENGAPYYVNSLGFMLAGE